MGVLWCYIGTSDPDILNLKVFINLHFSLGTQSALYAVGPEGQEASVLKWRSLAAKLP